MSRKLMLVRLTPPTKTMAGTPTPCRVRNRTWARVRMLLPVETIKTVLLKIVKEWHILVKKLTRLGALITPIPYSRYRKEAIVVRTATLCRCLKNTALASAAFPLMSFGLETVLSVHSRSLAKAAPLVLIRVRTLTPTTPTRPLLSHSFKGYKNF